MRELSLFNSLQVHQPECFENARLVTLDFDQTIGITSEIPPGGVDVSKAYEISIEDLKLLSKLDRLLYETYEEVDMTPVRVPVMKPAERANFVLNIVAT